MISVIGDGFRTSLPPFIRNYEVTQMQKILILGCNKMMDKLCIGCSRCLVALNRYEGEFGRYKEEKAELMGLAGCGECPGATLIARLAVMKLWNAPLGEEPTKIHLAPCLMHCQHVESITDKLKTKVRIVIVEGTHPYQMETIFG
jgi:predicted metal-binding protein